MTVLTETSQQYNGPEHFYQQSDYYQKLIKRSVRYLSTGYPVHFTGHAGIGKTNLALYLAHQLNRPVQILNGNKDLSTKDLIGSYTGYSKNTVKDNFVKSVYKTEETLSETWVDGKLLESVKKGYTLIYDEFTRAKPELNNIFLPILEERILPLYGLKQKQSYIDVHPNFSVIFTSNPDEYAGVYQSQDALLDRMITLPIEQMGFKAEVAAILSKTNLSKHDVEAIVSYVNCARKLSERLNQYGPSLRASLMIARIVEKYSIKVDKRNDEFIQLFLDVTLFSLQPNTSSIKQDKLKNQLLKSLNSIKVGEYND